jgi:ALG3 protein
MHYVSIGHVLCLLLLVFIAAMCVCVCVCVCVCIANCLLHCSSSLVLYPICYPSSSADGGIFNCIRKNLTSSSHMVRGVLPNLHPQHIVYVMFASNYIGIVFCRSMHYQFYSWYFFTLPFLLWRSRLNGLFQLLALVAIEYCWNVFPATPASSMLLQTVHFAVLSRLLFNAMPTLPNGQFRRVVKAAKKNK